MAAKRRPSGGKGRSGGPAGTRRGASPPARPRAGPTRAERLAAAERARRRRALQVRGGVAAAVAVVVGLVGFVALADRRERDRKVGRLEAGSCDYDTRTDADRGLGRNHVTGSPTYRTDPPSGGDHLASASPPGIFTAEDLPPDGQLVHSLEHGYVVLWHRPDLDPASLGELRALAGRFERDVLLVPRASLRAQVAATAWHKRLLCPTTDPAALELFVTSFRNEGPEKVPH